VSEEYYAEFHHPGILFPWEGKRCGKMEKFLQHKGTSHLDRAVSPRWPWESYLNITKLAWGCSELLQKAWEGKAGGQLLWQSPCGCWHARCCCGKEAKAGDSRPVALYRA